MATLLDVGALGFFLPVFVFIFIFSILLALIEKTKLLGDNKLLNVAAAFSVAAVSIFAGRLTSLIGVIVPWVVFIFVLLVLIFLIFQFFGIKERDIWDLFGEATVFIVILIIILVGITTVFEGTLSPYTGGPAVSGTGTDTTVNAATNPRSETLRTLTHPRLLGALFTLVVAAATVTYLTKKIEATK